MSKKMKQKTYIITSTEDTIKIIDNFLKLLNDNSAILVMPWEDSAPIIDTDNNDIPAQDLYRKG